MPLYFNPRPREEGDQAPEKLPCVAVYFNPRPREEGDHKISRRASSKMDFNPRPREEGDGVTPDQSVYCTPISIHALVKRATVSNKSIKDFITISIHALVKRATSFCIPVLFHVGYFNPRPREEGDSSHFRQLVKYLISIHALVKRATQSCTCPLYKGRISIHALVKRATSYLIGLSRGQADFNPRPREEGDELTRLL